MPEYTLPTLEDIVAAYNDFSLNYGWSSAAPVIEERDHTSVIETSTDLWRYKDQWKPAWNEDVISAGLPTEGLFIGATTIGYEAIKGKLVLPVYTASYRGLMAKSVEPIVKAALIKQYKSGIFHGGRGPESYQEDRGLRYIYDVVEELVDGKRGVVGFAGREAVYDDDAQECRGWLLTSGSVLIPGFSTYKPGD